MCSIFFPTGFKCQDVLQPRVFYPFLVILALMFLLQFSGQGAMTFYTALIFREAQQADGGGLLGPNDCSVVIGLTYLASSVLALVLKKHFGRRVLLLASELLMGAAQAWNFVFQHSALLQSIVLVVFLVELEALKLYIQVFSEFVRLVRCTLKTVNGLAKSV